jgi:HSP20 family protein
MSPVMRRLFFEPALDNFQECVWHPAVDVRRASYGWIIKAELPGVTAEELQVSAQGNSLLLWGVRKDTLLAEGESYYRLELSYCRFERKIDLPTSLEGAELRLSFDNGLVILRAILPSRERRP